MGREKASKVEEGRKAPSKGGEGISDEGGDELSEDDRFPDAEGVSRFDRFLFVLARCLPSVHVNPSRIQW